MRKAASAFAPTRRRRALAVGLIVLLAAGCATSRAMRDGQDAEMREHWDLALLDYQKAYQTEPGNLEAKAAYERLRVKAARVHYERGKIYHQSGQLDLAAVELEQSVALDSTIDAAQQEYKKIKADIEERQREVAGGTPTELAKEKTRGMRATPPMLNPASDKPIDVSFPPDTNIKKIYQALAAAAGINVIFDPQLKDDRFTLDLRGMTFQKALEVAMRQAGHFYKVLDEKTIIIAQDTQQNRREYEDLVIRTFFLSNGDVKDVSAMVRGVLDMRRLQPVPQLNAIVIRDTADKVAVAEKLIEINDKAKSEVVVDVELLLLSRDDELKLGMELSPYGTTASVVGSDGTTAVGSLTWPQIAALGLSNLSFTLPTVNFDFIEDQHGRADPRKAPAPDRRGGEGAAHHRGQGAGPRLDVQHDAVDRDDRHRPHHVVPVSGRRHQDGDRAPRPPQQGGVAEAPTRDFDARRLRAQSGRRPDADQIATRTISTTIRLKDGETNFLAGLVRHDKSQTKEKIPVLSDIPLLGSLFTHYDNSDKSTDIFMALTPHIVRQPQITEEDLKAIWVGTENNVSSSGLGARVRVAVRHGVAVRRRDALPRGPPGRSRPAGIGLDASLRAGVATQQPVPAPDTAAGRAAAADYAAPDVPRFRLELPGRRRRPTGPGLRRPCRRPRPGR